MIIRFLVSAATVLLTIWLLTLWARRTGGGASRGRIQIGNFGQVSPTYFRGEQPMATDYADLASLGVKLVICLSGAGETRPDERAQVEAAGMRFVEMPMNVHVAPTPLQISTFLSLVDDPANQPVFVHCVGGRHRTGVMTAVYRMVHDGISGPDAFKEMKQFRYGPDFLHPEYKAFVLGFNAARRPIGPRWRPISRAAGQQR